MIFVCEECGAGYSLHSVACPYCGTSNMMAHSVEPPVLMCDVETYRDYFLVKFSDGTEFQMFDGHLLDIQGLRAKLTSTKLVTFNGNNYDIPIITLALSGADNATLKLGSDRIIQTNLRSWQFYEAFNLNQLDLDHIDIFEVSPGVATGLKMYGGRMHTNKLQDLPIPPDASIDWAGRFQLREYCGNDLRVTEELFKEVTPQIKLREELGKRYGLDLRSKSDAQIAEAVIKSKLPFKPVKLEIRAGTQFYYAVPDFIKFQGLNVLDVIAQSPFTVTDTGSVEMTKELENTRIRIGNSTYRMGIGGLHSSEESVSHVADSNTVLSDHDVVSYYPAIILRLNLFPQQIGPAFTEIFRSIVEERIAAKRAGDKVTADAMKIMVNGTFGKTGSKYSVLYAPSLMIQTTITGQLSLLMLIEMLEICGIPVVSANTDGVVVKCPRNMLWLRDDVIKWWETTTGFETEANEYAALHSRDVNNYVAVKVGGGVKCKGIYATEGLMKNPANLVCVQAVTDYLDKGMPIEVTITDCRDVTRFLTVRQVKGGGQWKGQYLGKVVRWYYSKSNGDMITYVSNGNKVARSDGCVPMMDLIDGMPDDLDYDWYIREARAMLADIGVTR